MFLLGAVDSLSVHGPSPFDNYIRLMRRIAIGLVLALLVALPATAQDFLKGAEAFEQGNYTDALKEWRPLAEKGDVVAQFNLGNCYRLGKGVLRDYILAHQWFSLSAAKGSKYARESRNEVATLMSPSQIAEAQKLVQEWWAKHKKK